MLFPVGLDETRLNRRPWISIAILALCVLAFLATALSGAESTVRAKFEEVGSYWEAFALRFAHRRVRIFYWFLLFVRGTFFVPVWASLRPGVQPVDAFAGVMGELLAASGALAIPSPAAAAGRPFARFANAALFEEVCYRRRITADTPTAARLPRAP